MSEKKNPYEKPISITTDLYWNQIWYIKNESAQCPYSLIGLLVNPPRQILFRLRDVDTGDIVTRFDFECSDERDEAKYLKWKETDGDDPTEE